MSIGWRTPLPPAQSARWDMTRLVRSFVGPRGGKALRAGGDGADVMVRTYAEAGVDLDEKGAQVQALIGGLTFARRGTGKRVGPKGHYAGLVDFGRYALAMSTDGVGTKLLVANVMRRWDTVGIDCVAMNANDIVCVGAEPIAFVDYFAVDSYDRVVARQVGLGLNEGARQANVTIVGGEVAVMPEIVRGYDLAGTCLGFVPKNRILSGSAVRAGDVIIGLPSSGIHSNGLTLARRVMEEANLTVLDPVPGSGEPLGEALLRPTRIYVRPVLAAIRKHKVHGIAHITGGGLRNFLRLRETAQFRITDPLEPPPILRAIQSWASIEPHEMYQTFNMGMGMAIVAPKASARGLLRSLQSIGARVVGRVQRGRGVVHAPLGLSYDRY